MNNFLTEKWAIIQGGMKADALNLWIQVTRVLELDNKARRDLFLLAQSDLVGHTHANKLLWDLLTGPALEKKYLDLSNLVSNWVGKARKEFDRPPRDHVDLQWWTWEHYDAPRMKGPQVFSSKSASGSSHPHGRWRQTIATSTMLASSKASGTWGLHEPGAWGLHEHGRAT